MITETLEWTPGRNRSILHFRKRQPKPPTHEEIMTKWWKGDGSDECWWKCRGYSQYSKEYFVRGWRCKAWFIGRESADIPPEDA